MKKQQARLENWSVQGEVMRGEVYGHPLLIDSQNIRTSSIVKLDLDAKTCETRNTFYTLGKPHVELTGDSFMSLDKIVKLHDHCRKFIDDNKIHCAETVHQTDRVIENAYEFIEGVCDIVGYAKSEDE